MPSFFAVRQKDGNPLSGDLDFRKISTPRGASVGWFRAL